jgi:drug/metabolite transporter (DMT)-like permease
MWRIWLAALFWGLNWPMVKILLTGAGPWTIRAAGLGLGFLTLWGIVIASGQSMAIKRRYWAPLIVAGVLNVVCFNLFTVFAQMMLPASRAAILTYTMPLWSVVFARILLGEPIDSLRATALGLGALGILVLTRAFWPDIAGGSIPVGLVLVMAAAISWAAGTVYTKQARIEGAPMALTAWQILLGAVVASFGLALFETPRLELWRPEIALAFIYHFIFPQALAYGLWFSLITRVPASTAALGTLLVPIFGVGGAVILLGERPTIPDLTGFALILAAVLVDQGTRAWRGRAKVRSEARPS